SPLVDILSCMSLRNRLYRILCCVLCALSPVGAMAQSTHYSVKLVPDFERHVLLGDETIEFQANAGEVEWQEQAGLHIVASKAAKGAVTVAKQLVTVRVLSAGRHSVRFKFEAAAGRGIKWFTDNAGLATAFYCESWMVCGNSPGQRATLQLEIAVLFRPLTHGASGFRAVGPGRRDKEWRDRDADHFVFEQSAPVQTYLFSFAVARLAVAVDGIFSIYAQRTDASKAAFAKTADAYAFLRAAASVDPMNSDYTQAFLPGPSMGQEAAGMALMSQEDLANLVANDDVQLMAH